MHKMRNGFSTWPVGGPACGVGGGRGADGGEAAGSGDRCRALLIITSLNEHLVAAAPVRRAAALGQTRGGHEEWRHTQRNTKNGR